MVNKCCVPGCSSNYDSKAKEGHVTCFKFLNDKSLKEAWLRKIPRKDLTVTKYTVVCAKHFRESDIIKNDILPGKDGQPDILVPRKKFTLQKNAVPQIFPNLPSYLSSKNNSAPRPSPSKRRKRMEEVHVKLQEEWLSKDKIVSYGEFMNDVEAHLRSFKYSAMLKRNEEDVILFDIKIPENDESPFLSFSLRIDNCLRLQVWLHDIKMKSNELRWLQLNDNTLEYWSQLKNLLSRLHTEGDDDRNKYSNFSDKTLIEHATTLISKVATDDGKEVRSYLAEQLQLTIQSPSQRRFSLIAIVAAYNLNIKSPAAYEHIRNNMLILPSSRYLRQLSGNLSADVLEETNSYLKTKLKYLKPQERYINLLLDEIHIKPGVTYKNSKLTGTNDDGDIATSIHCFMITSLLSNNKDVVALVPATKITAEQLCTLTKSILQRLASSGYRVISIITDGNRINRKMFKLLAGCFDVSNLPSSIPNPCKPDEQIFFLFDSVHILKCIRNNWINFKNHKKTFTFPNFEDDEKLSRASFAELENLYLLETSHTLKKAPNLSWKALHPHSLERQSVKLALKIFTDTNAAALNCYGPNHENLEHWKGTATFIMLIWKWWSAVNVKHPFKGRNTSNKYARPIDCSDHETLQFLSDFATWLDRWSLKSHAMNEGFLTKDTYFGIQAHTKSHCRSF